MNAIELLRNDHDTVRGLLAQLSDTSSHATKQREELLDRIAQELEIHTAIEEEIFYPAFRDAGNNEHKKMYFEAKEEHRAVEKLVLPDLEGTEPGEETFGGRAKVLRELVEHHAHEEEDEMFAEASKLLSEDELQSLGERMEARKEELKKAAR